jgi:uncharacterized protein
MDSFFYVYAIKDVRTSPARPFYIGKGTGSRAFDHVVRPDTTPKYQRIKEILASGQQPLVDILVDNLTEVQALRIEAELIAAFGTVVTGGLLLNSVVPSGLPGKEKSKLIVPFGAIERAQAGLTILKSAVFELVKANQDGVRNSDTASVLGLRSDYRGRQKDYLTYSVLGLLLREGKISRALDSNKHRAVASG